LLQQLVELGRPMVVVLTMIDAAERDGLKIDVAGLEQALGGAPVYPVVATSGRGFAAVNEALGRILTLPPPRAAAHWPELHRAADAIVARLKGQGVDLHRVEAERLLIDSAAAGRAHAAGDVSAARNEVFGADPPLAAEARKRYAWVRAVLARIETPGSGVVTQTARLIDWINRPWPAPGLLLLVMFVVFQAVFAWATPLVDLIDAGVTGIGALVASVLPDGMLESLVVDGAIAGVGSVIVFLPQILILFLFIIMMEDTGYLARAAFLVDRAMRGVGLSGQSVIPLLSSFACAVPSIMATRVIPNRRDRIATILAAPFMTCSARLPVYALLIGAFVPAQTVGIFNLQGVVLFGLYGIGIVGGVATALLLRSSVLRGANPTFILALPEFRLPNARNVGIKLLDRVVVFLKRAGTVIFAVAVVVWVLTYFPRSPDLEATRAAADTQATATLSGEALEERLAEIDNQTGAAHLEQSWLGRAGHVVEPLFRPLGWDWRVSAGVIASFPAREVVVAVLGTIYAVGGEADEQTLAGQLTAARHADGSPVFTLPMVFGLLLFYAWCLQCAATLAVIRRETNSWRWPLFAWTYMTALGYGGALLIYQLGTA
jgi:ferrous iron transport protein B